MSARRDMWASVVGQASRLSAGGDDNRAVQQNLNAAIEHRQERGCASEASRSTSEHQDVLNPSSAHAMLPLLRLVGDDTAALRSRWMASLFLSRLAEGRPTGQARRLSH